MEAALSALAKSANTRAVSNKRGRQSILKPHRESLAGSQHGASGGGNGGVGELGKKKKNVRVMSKSDFVSRRNIMRLLYDFQTTHRPTEAIPEQRQATLEALLDAVQQRRDEEDVQRRKDEERAYTCNANVTLSSVHDDMLKEEEECQRIAEYFKSTFEEVSRRSKTDEEWKTKQFMNQTLMRQISQSARIATNNPAVREAMKDQIRKLAEQRVTEHHRSAAARRLKDFKVKHPEAEQAGKSHKTVPSTKIEIARPPAHAGAVRRERARKQALENIRRKSQGEGAEISASIAVTGLSAGPLGTSLNASGKGNKSTTTFKTSNTSNSPDNEEELTYADKFYRTHRCLFNPAQMEMAERVFRMIVKEKDEPSAAVVLGTSSDDIQTSESQVLIASDSSHEGMALKASQLALQQKGVLARKPMTLAMFQHALSRTFPNNGDSTMVKRIYSVMCGREAAERREGLTFAKFATYLSTLMLGTTQQKLFLCFEVLDTDRDGFISQHDLFMLLRSDADACVSSDFGVLMAWIVEAHEERTRLENEFASRQRKRRLIMRKALEDFASRSQEKQKSERHRDHPNQGINSKSYSTGSGQIEEENEEDGEDNDEDLEDNYSATAFKTPDHHEFMDAISGDLDDELPLWARMGDNEDDEISWSSFDSANDWLDDGSFREEQQLRELQEHCEQMSKMDFKDFKALWSNKGLPDLVRLVIDCFPQLALAKKEITNRKGHRFGRGGNNPNRPGSANPHDADDQEDSDPTNAKRVNFMANAVSLQKAKHGLLNTLRSRIRVTMMASHQLKASKKAIAESILQKSGQNKDNGKEDENNHDACSTRVQENVEPHKTHTEEEDTTKLNNTQAASFHSIVKPGLPPTIQEGESEEEGDKPAPRPGKFLRELGISINIAKAVRASFQKMKPDTIRGTVSQTDFVAALRNARVGFEVSEESKVFCEGIFRTLNESKTGFLTFSEFLTGISIALQGTRRDRARLTFFSLLQPGKSHLEAHELENLTQAGLTMLDPVLSDYLTDLVVTRVSRGDKGFVYFKDLLIFGEEIRQRKEELMAQTLAARVAAQAASIRHVQESDRDSQGSAKLRMHGSRFHDKRFRSTSSGSSSSLAFSINEQVGRRRGRRRVVTSDLHADPRPIEIRLGDFELQSTKDHHTALRQNPEIDYVLAYKLVEAFLPIAMRSQRINNK